MAENALPELPYERIAMAGGEMPDGLTSADQQLFIELRLLYDTFKRKVITREIAQKEKQKLLRNYQVNLIMQDFVRQWYSQNIKTESARQAYRKKPNFGKC